MTTLADITLRVAQLVTDVMDGAATAGTATSLTDTLNLVQNNQYWDRGTLWIRSGNHAGKVASVTGFLANKLSFATLGTAIAAADRYSVARASYPWNQIVSAVRQALDETHVEGDDNSHIGDGETLEFVLPVGVWDVKRVEFERDGYEGKRIPSHHYIIKDQTLRFDYGYAPCNDDIIHILWRDTHPELTSYSAEISDEINVEWLKNKAAEILLYWGAAQYGKNPEYLIEERINRVMNNLRGKMPRYDGPDFEIRTAGGD